MESLKILIFNWRCWLNPEMGGAEVFTREVARRWVEAGHEVTLFTSEFPGCEKQEVMDGVGIVRAGGKYSVYWRAKKYYKKDFSREGYDVVIDEINTRPFLTPKFVEKEKIIGLIHQLAREFWFYETPLPMNLIGYYYLENKWLKNYVDIPTVTVSNSTKEDLLSLGFKRIFLVHNGVNVEPLEKPPKKNEKPAIICVGRMKKAKRPQDAIKAFHIVKEQIKDAELWMVGDGYLRKKLERKAREGIRFFGHMDEKMKTEFLRKAWVIVVPGVREGWGQVVIDANALGTPAVAYDVPGLRDSIMDGETGLLVKDNGDFRTLAGAIVKILRDDGLRKRLSEKALEWAKNFDWDKSAEEFMKVLERVANE